MRLLILTFIIGLAFPLTSKANYYNYPGYSHGCYPYWYYGCNNRGNDYQRPTTNEDISDKINGQNVAIHGALTLGAYSVLRVSKVPKHYALVGAFGTSVLISLIEQMSYQDHQKNWKQFGMNSLGAATGLVIPIAFDF